MESEIKYQEPNTDLRNYCRVSGVALWKVSAHPNYGITEQALRNRLHKAEFTAEQKSTFMRTVDEINQYQRANSRYSMPIIAGNIEAR